MSRQAAWSDCEECPGLNFMQDAFYIRKEKQTSDGSHPYLCGWFMKQCTEENRSSGSSVTMN